MTIRALRLVVCLFWIAAAAPAADVEITGEAKRWHRLTLTFEGPYAAEDAIPNPFRDYRLDVTFTHPDSGKRYVVPGFFAADGDAAESSARSGDRWRVRFTPDRVGDWRYKASFRMGQNVALGLDTCAGTPVAFHGTGGVLQIAASDKQGRDFRAKGRLDYVGEHYLRHAGTGERFLKGGADSPENFLAYAEFDDTWDSDANAGSANYRHVGEFIHRYEPHAGDFRPGDPTWQGGKGKNIIGALNYLASEGMNSVYFVTYNIDGGDGRDTWVWTSPEVRDRFDVSKLAEWEIVFSHMDRLGLMMHVVLQETENDEALGGDSAVNDLRQLYFREMVARFGHHPALIWNLGEESDLPGIHLRQNSAHLRELDPYQHPITVHTHNRMASCYRCIVGEPTFELTSIQGEMEAANAETVRLRNWSAKMGRPWAIFHDEQTPATVGVKPDSEDPDHDEPRQGELWGNLMGGGSGVEWYFGSDFDDMDINAEDWRSRDLMWDQTRYALEFFRQHLPFWEMAPANDLVVEPEVEGDEEPPVVYVLAKAGEVYAVYMADGGTAELTLPAGEYNVQWYDPRDGGALQTGSLKSLTTAEDEAVSIGEPPSDVDRDWTVLLRRM